MDFCLQEKKRQKLRRKHVHTWMILQTYLPRCTALLQHAGLIGSLTLALKLQDHPGERYKGFLSCVPAFNLRQRRQRP